MKKIERIEFTDLVGNKINELVDAHNARLAEPSYIGGANLYEPKDQSTGEKCANCKYGCMMTSDKCWCACHSSPSNKESKEQCNHLTATWTGKGWICDSCGEIAYMHGGTPGDSGTPKEQWEENIGRIIFRCGYVHLDNEDEREKLRAYIEPLCEYIRSLLSTQREEILAEYRERVEKMKKGGTWEKMKKGGTWENGICTACDCYEDECSCLNYNQALSDLLTNLSDK